MLTTDAESVYESLTSLDSKAPPEKTSLGHVSSIRELLLVRIIKAVQGCHTSDMIADGDTKGCIGRELLSIVGA